jgi:hypothetical protein
MALGTSHAQHCYFNETGVFTKQSDNAELQVLFFKFWKPIGLKSFLPLTETVFSELIFNELDCFLLYNCKTKIFTRVALLFQGTWSREELLRLMGCF